MKIDLTGQVALVTGGSRGIGKAIAQGLLQCGAEVILTATREIPLSVLRQEYGRAARCAVVDFASRESIEGFLSAIESLQRLDILINNAGVALHRPLAEIGLEDWETTQQINLHAPLLMCQAAAPLMRKNHYGRIVNIASVLAHIGRGTKAAYSASKAGLAGLTRTMAVELAADGILVNCVSPGMTATSMLESSYSPEQLRALNASTPLQRAGTPQEIAAWVVFAASPLNGFMTGQTLVVDGGATIV